MSLDRVASGLEAAGWAVGAKQGEPQEAYSGTEGGPSNTTETAHEASRTQRGRACVGAAKERARARPKSQLAKRRLLASGNGHVTAKSAVRERCSVKPQAGSHARGLSGVIGHLGPKLVLTSEKRGEICAIEGMQLERCTHESRRTSSIQQDSVAKGRIASVVQPGPLSARQR